METIRIMSYHDSAFIEDYAREVVDILLSRDLDRYGMDLQSVNTE